MLSTFGPSSLRKIFSSNKPGPQQSGLAPTVDGSDINTLVDAPSYTQSGLLQAPSATGHPKSPQDMTANDRMEAAFAAHRAAGSALSNANTGTQGDTRLGFGGRRRGSDPEAQTATRFANTRARFAKLTRRRSDPSGTRAAKRADFLRLRDEMKTRIYGKPKSTEAATAPEYQPDWTQQQSQPYINLMAKQATAYANMVTAVGTAVLQQLAQQSFAQQSAIQQSRLPTFGYPTLNQSLAPASIVLVFAPDASNNGLSQYAAGSPSNYAPERASVPGSVHTMFDQESARSVSPFTPIGRPGQPRNVIYGGDVVDRTTAPESPVSRWLDTQA
jgi:hypothetical protein